MIATLSNLKAKYREYKQHIEWKEQLEKNEEIVIVHCIALSMQNTFIQIKN